MMQTRQLNHLICLFIAAGLLFCLGCKAGNYASLKTSADLMAQYKGGSLDTNYQYYYVGRSGLPYVVVGIDRAYTFDDKFWVKIETQEDVYKKIRNLADLEPDQYKLYAKDIISPDNQKVGVYFSYYLSAPAMVDEEKKQVTVYNPYKPGSRGGLGF